MLLVLGLALGLGTAGVSLLLGSRGLASVPSLHDAASVTRDSGAILLASAIGAALALAPFVFG